MNKKTKIIAGVAIFLVILAGVYFVLNADNAQSKTVKIGGLFALTGKWEVGGATEANFAKIAVDEINKNGGIKGRQIQFIIEDEKCSGKDAVNAIQKLINQDNTKIILGPSCTPASGAVAPISEQNEAFIMAFTTTAKDIFKNNHYAFRTSPPSTDAANLIGELAKNKYKLQKIALITESTDFGRSWAQDFSQAFKDLGGEVVLSEEYSTGTTDFRSLLAKIKSAEVDGIFISPQAPQDGGLIVKQVKELGFLDSIKILGNPTAIDSKSFEASGGALPKDAFSVVPYAPRNELFEKYVSRYGKEPGFQFFYTASAYDVVYMLKSAIEKCGEDPVCVSDYFRSLKDWKGKVASWSFNEKGDPVISRKDYAELNIIDGKSSFTSIAL